MNTQDETENMRQRLFQASQDGRTQRRMLGAGPMPDDPYGQSQPQQMTPEMRRQMIAQHFQKQIMGQPATTAAGGMTHLAAGLGSAIGNYSQQGQQFPTAPGGGSPSFGTTLGNFFTGRQNGGLY